MANPTELGDSEHLALEAEFELQVAIVHFRKKRYAEASACLAKADTLDPENGEILAWRAWTDYHTAPDLRILRERLRKAITASPDCVTAHFFLGESHFFAREKEQALGFYRHVLNLRPDHKDALRRVEACRPKRRTDT